MKTLITVHEDKPPVEAPDARTAVQVLSTAGNEARARNVLNVVMLEAENGRSLLIVVGGDETVLGFRQANDAPPYYASRGKEDAGAGVVTAYAALVHHTEFPRRWVIPLAAGMRAVREFCQTGDQPKCVEWTLV